MSVVVSATAHHVTTKRLGGAVHVFDGNTGQQIGQIDTIRGFGHYYGTHGSAHEGIEAVVRGGVKGVINALDKGLVNGRDDRR